MDKKKQKNTEQIIFIITLIVGISMLKYPVQAYFNNDWYAATFYGLSALMILPWTRRSIESSFNTKLLSFGYISAVTVFFVLGFIYSIL